MSPRILRAATRRSPLARWQAERVATLVRGAHPEAEIELVLLDSEGDRRQDRPISEIGGKGVFAKDVQAAVLDGRADFAVHSTKDLPAVTVEGLVLAAVPERGDARDALVGARLDDLAPGATVATGSPRRRAQLADLRPDLAFVELRGNMATRLSKVPPGGAIVVAAVALERLGLADRISQVFEVDQMVPQVGQGSLAVEARVGDEETRRWLAAIEHAPSRVLVDAERAFLAELGGDCDLPAGAHARFVDGGGYRDDQIELIGFLAGPADGARSTARGTTVGADPARVGTELARRLRAEFEAGSSSP